MGFDLIFTHLIVSGMILINSINPNPLSMWVMLGLFYYARQQNFTTQLITVQIIEFYCLRLANYQTSQRTKTMDN